MKKSILLLMFPILLPLAMYSQKITNVHAQQEGQTIAIYYDLRGNANIRMEMTINGQKMPINAISGDVGKRVKEGKDRKIIWNVLEDVGMTFNAENVVFTVKATSTWNTFIIAEGAMSFAPIQGSGGIMIGRVSKWGYYAKLRSSFQFAPVNGSFSSHGAYLNEYGNISTAELQTRFTAQKRNTELIADIGAMYNVSRNTDFPVCVYLGGGFGMRRQMWEIDNNNWVQYSPTSHIGFSGDLGVLASFKGFTIDVGVNTINFRYMEVQFGLGWMFNK